MAVSEKRIWGLPIRLTHWGLAFSFFGAYITSERPVIVIHEAFAFVCLTLVIFRIFWGFIGSDTARFKNFVTGYGPVRAYFDGLLKLRHKEYWGHNPLGALAVVSIILLMLLTVSGGLFAQTSGFSAPWAKSVSPFMSGLLNDAHSTLAGILMIVVVVHITAILFYRFVLNDNLIKPMVTGQRPADQTMVEPRFAPIWLALGTLAVAVAIAGAVFRYWLL